MDGKPSSHGVTIRRLTRLSEGLVKPRDYLTLAKEDLSKRAAVNALSNAKRAIDSQMDIILEYFGLLGVASRKKWPFPKKTEIIRRLGVVSPGILKQVNSARNQLEHSHRKPDVETVTMYVDIAELFVELFREKVDRPLIITDTDQDFILYSDIIGEQMLIYGYDERLNHLDYEDFLAKAEKHGIKPRQTVSATDLDEWIQACKRYIDFRRDGWAVP